tara:strand:- start:67 stop:321 length:255 start_codon:yes stop_codon:yes gene_type:complete
MTILVRIIRVLCDVLAIFILLRVVVSWYSPGATNKPVIILYRITEPLLAPLRRIIPRFGPLDFSPLVAVILLQLIRALSLYLLP